MPPRATAGVARISNRYCCEAYLDDIVIYSPMWCSSMIGVSRVDGSYRLANDREAAHKKTPPGTATSFILGPTQPADRVFTGSSESPFVWSLTQDQFAMGEPTRVQTPLDNLAPGIPGTHKPLHFTGKLYPWKRCMCDASTEKQLFVVLVLIYIFTVVGNVLRYILYEACLSYMFFVLFFASIQSWTLVIMAYDRFIAIWFPLRYHSIVTKTSIAAMLAFEWLLITTIVASTVGLIDRLSFSLSRIASGEERLKALKTCTSHVILVAIFFLPLVGTNIAAVASYIHPNARIINSTLTYTIPALLNPIIYALKTEEVMNAVKKLWKKKTFINTA
ncbi:olfactory receptor 4C3-like [Oreochromis niloticus]|uniref:olfactory receptor 4C3-like n=1 Tax=Oreochromis niloticus TaxID=8128 RepID=UPI000DF1C556|nr:olfactory receptor 4C3-like [Oreochromis niloticus]